MPTKNINEKNKCFKPGYQLTPSQVYCMGVGVFESNTKYTLVKIIPDAEYGSLQNPELGRVYRDTTTGKQYLWAFPGKDNDERNTAEHPLSYVHDKTKAFLEQNNIGVARKIFPICESNEYQRDFSCVHVKIKTKRSHFVLMAQEGNYWILVDSIKDVGYPLNYFGEKLSHSYLEVHTNLQKNNTDCGHHTIQNLIRNLKGFEFLDSNKYKVTLKINDAILKQHYEYFVKGSALVCEFGETKYPEQVQATIVKVTSRSSSTWCGDCFKWMSHHRRQGYSRLSEEFETELREFEADNNSLHSSQQ